MDDDYANEQFDDQKVDLNGLDKKDPVAKDNGKGGRKSTKSKKWEDGDEYYGSDDDEGDEEWNMSDKDLALGEGKKDEKKEEQSADT
jgi:hypothetical protein